MPDQTDPRDRIAAALRPHASLGGTPPRYELPFFDGATPGLPRISGWKPLDDVAADVAAVLPPPADRAAVARVRALHQEYMFGDDEQVYCAHCNQLSNAWIPWPCPTVKALDGEASHQPRGKSELEGPEEAAQSHVLTLHQIGEQLAGIESWMWEHLADVRDSAKEERRG